MGRAVAPLMVVVMMVVLVRGVVKMVLLVTPVVILISAFAVFPILLGRVRLVIHPVVMVVRRPMPLGRPSAPFPLLMSVPRVGSPANHLDLRLPLLSQVALNTPLETHVNPYSKMQDVAWIGGNID
jgi:hypothetical protein